MKKKVSILLVIALILSSVIFDAPFRAGAIEEYEYTDNYDSDTLLNRYSTAQIVAMYPDASEHIASEIRALNTDISLVGYNINKEDFGAIYFSIICENPDIFYVLPNRVRSTANMESGILISARPEYIFDSEIIPAEIDKFNNKADYILSGIDQSWDDVTKARYVHDMLAINTEYDIRYDEISSEDYELFKKQMRIYTAYGALIDNNAVCEGYTMAYNFLLSRIGIKAYYIQSTIARHSWSMVKIGGKFYHIDVSHDDPTEDTLGRVNHRFFLKSDSFLENEKENEEEKHHIDWITNLKATDTSYDDAWWNDIASVIYRFEGADYYINQTYSSSIYSAFTKRDIQTEKVTVLRVNQTRWAVKNVPNGFWERAYTYLAARGNYFYFNDTEKVYRALKGTKTFETVYTKPSFISNDIYGIAARSDGELYITIKSSPNVGDVIFRLTVSENNPTNPSGPTNPNEEETTSPISEAPTEITQATTEGSTTPAATEPKATEAPVTVIKKSITLYVNYYTTITISGVSSPKYSTSDKTVATVSSKGKITAKKAGKAKVYITASGVKVVITVTVKNPYLSVTSKKLKKGKSFTLTVKKGAGLITFKSSNKKIASVSTKGKVKALKKGKATITVTVSNIKLKCKITVV